MKAIKNLHNSHETGVKIINENSLKYPNLGQDMTKMNVLFTKSLTFLGLMLNFPKSKVCKSHAFYTSRRGMCSQM